MSERNNESGSPGADSPGEGTGYPAYTYGIGTVGSLSRRTRLSFYRLLGVPLVIGLLLAVHPWTYADSAPSAGPGQYPGTSYPAPVDTASAGSTDSAAPGSATTAADAGSPTAGGASQAASLDQLLDSATTARQSVVTAVQDIGTCGSGAGLSNDIATLQQAASTRRGLASQATSLPMDGVNGGAQAAQDLSTALTDSAKADDDYTAWATDLSNSGCNTATADQDTNFQAGAKDSQQASTDKDAFVAEWSPIAAAYSLQTRSSSSF